MRASTSLAGVILLTGLVGACASRGPVRPEPFPRPEASARTSSEATATLRGSAVVTAALELRGVPYAPGGSTPDGFDCSGFVQYVFATEGIHLPRTVREQFVATREIDRASVVAGDLLFFRTSGPRASHVGIATGDGAFVHAPSSRGVVRVERLDAPYWHDRFASARRVQ
jgi:cell wall-associated NlpC family hydrolase